MSDPTGDSLLARLAGRGSAGGDNPWATLAATRPKAAGGAPAADGAEDPQLADLMERINRLTAGEGDQPGSVAGGRDGAARTPVQEGFVPQEPVSFREAGLTATEVESLILKFLMSRGDAVGRDIADQV